jgi:DNA-binding MarR family transcriptional regulator
MDEKVTRPTNGPYGYGRGDVYSLIRHAHIFSSAVRETLETKLLGEIGANDISLPQFHLLKLIALNGTHQIGEVADFLGVTPPAATKAIDKLEGMGLVSRSPSKDDRRATLLSSSKRGRDLVHRYETVKQERLRPVLDQFSKSELFQFVGMLERFSMELIRTEGESEGLCLRCSAYFDRHCPVQHLHDGCPYQNIIADKPRGAAKSQEANAG